MLAAITKNEKTHSEGRLAGKAGSAELSGMTLALLLLFLDATVVVTGGAVRIGRCRTGFGTWRTGVEELLMGIGALLERAATLTTGAWARRPGGWVLMTDRGPRGADVL